MATELIDTGSPAKTSSRGPGNLEIHLDGKLGDRRVFPSIDIQKSGTRKEELLLPKEDLSRVYVLRKVLTPLHRPRQWSSGCRRWARRRTMPSLSRR